MNAIAAYYFTKGHNSKENWTKKKREKRKHEYMKDRKYFPLQQT